MLAKIIIVAYGRINSYSLPYFLLKFNLILGHALTEEINLGLIMYVAVNTHTFYEYLVTLNQQPSRYA